MKYGSILKKLLVVFALFTSLTPQAEEYYDNPIVTQRADPWVIQDPQTKCYYFIGTEPQFNHIVMRQACRLNDLKIAEEKVVWSKNQTGPASETLWAPELHRLNGKWYIYFAGGEKGRFYIRMHALVNESQNPMEGTWRYAGRILTDIDTFALDATVFEHNGKHYMAWAQQDEKISYNSALWIAEMLSPTELKLPATLLSEPTLDWEIQGYKVNEGPAIIKNGNNIFMTYSASATDHRYQMGLLWVAQDQDLLDAKNWQKSQQPVFSTNPKVGRYGPGHNSFTTSEDGKRVLMVYHARDYKELRGNPLSDPNRHARVREVQWDANGFPLFNNEQGD